MAHILVVDDEPMVCSLLAIAAQGWGHTVAKALSVSAAEKVLAEQKIELVITDFSMPGRNGLDLIQSIRGQGLRLPIIVHSASGRSSEMLIAGADRFLAKPASLATLEQAISQVLNAVGPASERQVQ